MTLRTSLLKMADRLRGIPSKACIDVRTVRVIVRSRQWSSGKIQTGTAIVTDLEILPRPFVRGTAGDPILTVGPITPAYSTLSGFTGGYTVAQINPVDSRGFEWTYVIIGPDDVERPYKLQRLLTVGAFHYTLYLEALDRVVPF